MAIEYGFGLGIGFAVIGLVLGLIVNVVTPISETAGVGVNSILNIYFSAPVIGVVTAVVLLLLLSGIAPALRPLIGLVKSFGGNKGSYD